MPTCCHSVRCETEIRSSRLSYFSGRRREDISANIGALEELQATYGCELLFVESGGDNLAGMGYLLRRQWNLSDPLDLFPEQRITRANWPTM